MNINHVLDEGAVSPVYATYGDAGLDLRSVETSVLRTMERATFRTGLYVEIPLGYAGFVMSRSGLAANFGIIVLNAPGVIDSGYRGEIKVVLFNTDKYNERTIHKGDRIAQLVIQRVEHVSLKLVESLDSTVRGDNGIGSTGVA